MRDVTSHLEAEVRTRADLILAVAVAATHEIESEQLAVTLNGRPVDLDEHVDRHGARRHLIVAEPGRLVVDYAASVGVSSPATVDPYDRLEFLRPSRYCDSDRLINVAQHLFGGSHRNDLESVERMRRWVLDNIRYAPGTTDQFDGASDVYLSRQGVCRDSAHLLVAFCRALGVPARVVSVYAPGLFPMDFHAVAEVLIDGQWHVMDGTGLAPRPSMVRIAVGRDATDTAFLDNPTGVIELSAISVGATVRGELPYDDGVMPVEIS